MNQLPLIADLDGTILRTDSFYEGLWQMLATAPCATFDFLSALQRGRLVAKNFLLPFALQTVHSFPLNEPVLDYVKQAVSEGREFFLATASPYTIAEAIAQRLHIPVSEIFASDGKNNLKGEVKAKALCAKFGEKGFDYIGDSLADVPIWKVARKALVASADHCVIVAARKVNEDCLCLSVSSPKLKDYVKAFRIQQWGKNILLFAPMLLAHRFSDVFGNVFLAFLSFCFCASGIYILNDLLDVQNDRMHPVKKKRPFASGALSMKCGPIYAIGLFLCALLPCFFLPSIFCYWLLAYFFCTIAYSVILKKRLMLDVIALAGLYLMRIIGGAAAFNASLSNWLMAFALFFFFGLALLKRTGGLAMLEEGQKLAGRAYTSTDLSILESMAIASGFAALIVMTLYIDSLQALQLYTSPHVLWIVCPILAFWYFRMTILAHRGIMKDDPVEFAFRDKTSVFCGFGLIAVFLLAS